ncbi:MAG: aspartate kinase [bacterium]|nr:aspartate kinase [bacterium]
MSIVVQKYGGTSVGSIQRIQAVAQRVLRTKAAGHQVVVVVSAMAGETDRLLRLAQDISAQPEARELDMLLNTGEMVSIALLAMALNDAGCQAASFTGIQGGIVTDNVHTRARIKQITTTRLLETLRADRVPVVAGFQGVSETQEFTTLGRGGSDLTAVALAAALEADVCEIYTDVDGVYSADPNIVSDARLLRRISYDEMLELARLGAQVLQARSVLFAKKFNVPVVVKSSFSEGEGTVITKADQDMERVVVSGIAVDKDQAKITLMHLPDRPGIAGKLFGRIAAANIVVDMIIQNASEGGLTDISFTVPRPDAQTASALARQLLPDIEAEDATLQMDIAKVSIVGVGMQSHSGVAASMFRALAAENINILMISTSEIKVSCVIHDRYAELAVRVLHDVFQLASPRQTD